MKNSLKFLFLLTSLFSAVVSTSNSSFPPVESDFTIGKNSSELVERRVELFLSGGAGVKVLTFYPKGKSSQRECTLSFPVRDTVVVGYKGYLTSWNCGNGDVFVRGFKVGECIVPNNFDPKRGLDYVFVRIFDDYWGERSSSLAFREVFNDNRFEALPMTIPTEPPFVGVTVCAYGGGSGFTCGAIVDLNVVIDVYVPWERSNGGKYTTDKLFGITKVLMEKDYTRGDMGAPVYIPAQIPFAAQLIAAPVGMVVENVEPNREPNAWYYTPIHQILQDSGLPDKDNRLELILGDFSSEGDKY